MNTNNARRMPRTLGVLFAAALLALAACGGQDEQVGADGRSTQGQHLTSCDPTLGCGTTGDAPDATTVKFYNAFANVVHISGNYSTQDPYQNGTLASGLAVNPGATVTLTTLHTASGSMNLQLSVDEAGYGGAIGFTPSTLNSQCVATYYGMGASPAFQWACNAL